MVKIILLLKKSTKTKTRLTISDGVKSIAKRQILGANWIIQCNLLSFLPDFLSFRLSLFLFLFVMVFLRFISFFLLVYFHSFLFPFLFSFSPALSDLFIYFLNPDFVLPKIFLYIFPFPFSLFEIFKIFLPPIFITCLKEFSIFFF